MGRLVIDGKDVYELDEDCLRRKQKTQKKETGYGKWYTGSRQREEAEKNNSDKKGS